MSRYAEEIERGMAYLDETAPGWEGRIDLGRLRMIHCHDCLCGQLCGDYYEFKRANRLSLEWMREHGFVLALGQDSSGSYPTLTAEWVTAIRARREAAHAH